jgi:hypothetical protein
MSTPSSCMLWWKISSDGSNLSRATIIIRSIIPIEPLACQISTVHTFWGPDSYMGHRAGAMGVPLKFLVYSPRPPGFRGIVLTKLQYKWILTHPPGFWGCPPYIWPYCHVRGPDWIDGCHSMISKPSATIATTTPRSMEEQGAPRSKYTINNIMPVISRNKLRPTSPYMVFG